MKTDLIPTQNGVREPTRRPMNRHLADVPRLGLQADFFTEVSRGVDKLRWLVEAHAQSKE